MLVLRHEFGDGHRGGERVVRGEAVGRRARIGLVLRRRPGGGQLDQAGQPERRPLGELIDHRVPRLPPFVEAREPERRRGGEVLGDRVIRNRRAERRQPRGNLCDRRRARLGEHRERRERRAVERGEGGLHRGAVEQLLGEVEEVADADVAHRASAQKRFELGVTQ